MGCGILDNTKLWSLPGKHPSVQRDFPVAGIGSWLAAAAEAVVHGVAGPQSWAVLGNSSQISERNRFLAADGAFALSDINHCLQLHSLKISPPGAWILPFLPSCSLGERQCRHKVVLAFKMLMLLCSRWSYTQVHL